MKIYVAGINGMVGSSVARIFRSKGFEVIGKSSKELDFTNRADTFKDIKKVSPDILIIAVPSIHIESTLSTIDAEDLKDKLIISAVKGVLPKHNILLNQWLAQQFKFQKLLEQQHGKQTQQP